MPRNVDGEFEVLLGNRQLLSILFIVVVLLAVFFSMGYVIGRRAGPRSTSAQLPPAAGAPVAGDQASGFPETSAPAADTQPRQAVAEETSTDAAAVRTGTQPQQRMPVTESPKPPVVPPPAAEAPPSAPVAGQTFLQATAAKRPDAELVASVLRKKGFPVVLAPGPSETVFRVLVGPFTDADGLAKARAGLETAGFKPFTRKY
ncbi:MAG: SPOR domain-containing protein [Bryobacteraceae bacterium]